MEKNLVEKLLCIFSRHGIEPGTANYLTDDQKKQIIIDWWQPVFSQPRPPNYIQLDSSIKKIKPHEINPSRYLQSLLSPNSSEIPRNKKPIIHKYKQQSKYQDVPIKECNFL